jgi:hypothetical protein
MVNKLRPLKATARYEAVCDMCGDAIVKGSRITTWGRSWVHLNCLSPEPNRIHPAHRPWLRHLKTKEVDGTPDVSSTSPDRPSA